MMSKKYCIALVVCVFQAQAQHSAFEVAQALLGSDQYFEEFKQLVSEKLELCGQHAQGVENKAFLQDTRGNTLLHEAVLRGSLHGVELLLASGAQINVANEMGATPLLLAVHNLFNSEIVHVLLKGGADVNLQEHKYGRSPLHVAARLGFGKFVKLLLEYGADADLKDRTQRTARDVAATQEVRDLLDAAQQEFEQKVNEVSKKSEKKRSKKRRK